MLLRERTIGGAVAECSGVCLPIGTPDTASQIRIVLSSEPETMWVPSGENATDWTEPERPCRGSPIGAPDAASKFELFFLRT